MRENAGVDVREAADLLDRGDAVALDVREQYEWDAGRMPGALHVPMAEVGERYGELPLDRTVVVVCRSGQRSDAIATALREAGVDARNLDGGMKAWSLAGLPLEPADGRIG